MSSPRATGLRAGDGIVLRTPALPMTELAAWAAAGDPRSYLVTLIDVPAVREALFVASPSLSDAIASWKSAPLSTAGQRVEHSLVKYVARMMGRSTPFGLFSAVSAGRLGRTTELELAPREEYRRRTRIDNDYLFVLADQIARTPEARAKLQYRPNTSIYSSAGRLRYASARVVGKERSYHLISVEVTPYLVSTLALAAAGATRDQLAAPLATDDISADEASAYVDELIDAQLLVPELGVFVTGPEPIDGMLDQLRAAGIDGPRPILEAARAGIAAIDAAGVGNAADRYEAIAAALAPLETKVDRARLFQVDMIKPAAATLGTRVATDVARVIEQLARILPGVDRSLDDFKRAFRERYEDESVPLAEAIDEESGIGFETVRGPGSEGAPLLAGLAFPGTPSENRVRWGAFESYLLERLAGALQSGAAEIVIDDADLEALKLPDPPALPEALSAMIRIEGTAAELAADTPTILFEGADGPSGARLLGRFSHASPEIEAIVRAHHVAEEALRPDAVFAEIVHLNEGRIGNILCRPVLRGHEIVYLGLSGADDDAQIALDDLLVSVRDDRIVLTSKRLGKEIVPRLTTAHNFRARSLGVYRFLCVLASQGTRGVMWSWGPLASAPFLPRVRIGRVVVDRARWHLDKRELAPITTAVRAAAKHPDQRAAVLEAVAALRKARRLPRMFAIVDFDNELPIDLDNPLLAAAFADEVSGDSNVTLTELFPAIDRLVVHGPEGSYSNELVVTFTQPRAPERAAAPASTAPTIRRDFGPGSEWLYTKIYCGESTADRVLGAAIAPVIREATEGGEIQQWFFLRYADPEPHLRVRFRGEPAALLGSVLPALDRALAPLVEIGAVRKLVVDTYAREIERYGGDRGIELVEEIFWRDSEAVLAIVELLEGDDGAIARWKLALRGIESLLVVVGLDADARAKVVTGGRESIGREVHAGTPLWSQLGDRFTKERPELEILFARDPARDAAHDLQPGFEILATRDAAIRDAAAELVRRDLAGELAPSLIDLSWSLVHMHANRLLHASQRAQEMVLYDFLRRLHASRKARSKS